MLKYDHKKIEKKWQRFWEQEQLYEAKSLSKKPKYYVLIEFPYPSGERLHVGHARSYSVFDVVARKRRMQGYNVLFPIGWDAFGLPAENYAIKTGIHPAVTTKKNIANAKAQAKSWGLSFDWSREINTTDPKYYKWTQWIFLKLFKNGLSYRAEIPVNWCPSCKINLANEEVIDGKCERCETLTTRRSQNQWLLKITAYAERLLADLEKVNYREDIKRQQAEWIGKSEGAVIKFKILNPKVDTVETFTTRLDTLFGVTALVIAPDKTIEKNGNKRPLALEMATKDNYQKVKKYIEASQSKSELERIELKEKTGVFTGAYAVNPVNKEKIPVWVADYVIGWYGEGAVMLVPAHDERDFEFSQKYRLKTKKVLKPERVNKRRLKSAPADEVFEDDGVLINSGKYRGLTSREARDKLLAEGQKAGWARPKITYKLRDWVFSRQHYWGEPIPMIYCQSCAQKGLSWFTISQVDGSYDEKPWESAGWFPVPEEKLPVELPYVKHYEPTETGESPLAAMKNWVNVRCSECGGEAKRETDTMPNWAGSSWYFLAYTFADKLKSQKSNRDKLNIFVKSKKELKYWLPVDWYNGGLEHTTLHLLYSRFWHKFLFDIGVVPTPEPYAKRTSHGVVLGPDGHRMSKSRGNVINPDKVLKDYGADTLRMYEMFMGPFEQQIAWDDKALAGVHRFLDRFWQLYLKKGKIEALTRPQSLIIKLHQTIKKVGNDIEELKFNTAIAVLMEFANAWRKNDSVLSWGDAGVLLRLLAPFAPHITEELWQYVCQNCRHLNEKNYYMNGLYEVKSIHLTPWPEYDPNLTREETAQIPVQVNGKFRTAIEIEVEKSKNKEEVKKLAQASEKVQHHLKGKKVKEIIFVPGKLINYVAN